MISRQLKQQGAGDRVKEVRVTLRLTDSPACLVADENAMSMNLERMLKAAGQQVPSSAPILEINTRHPIVEKLSSESDEGRFGGNGRSTRD